MLQLVKLGLSCKKSSKYDSLRLKLNNFVREVSFFTWRGLLKIGGIRYFFLDQKEGSKDFFKLKRRDHLYF